MKDNLHNKSKTLYDLIAKKYSLDDETRKELKKIKYDLRSDDIDQITLKEEEVTSKVLVFSVKKQTISGKYNYFDYSISSGGI